MKKLFLTLSILLCCILMQASPVSVEEANALGAKFLGADVEMVCSTSSYYVFNAGSNGFVIISADDSYRPIIGYSREGAFEPDNIAPALQEFLADIDQERVARGVVAASQEAVEDWAMLRKHGKLMSRHGGREGSFLLTTQWNQNYPYNYCCPVDANGPGGHVYAGCVATAAAQLMKYWNHPLQGTGSHTYTPQDNPQYGPLTANFGATTYDWDNMPDQISASSPVEQLEAIGTLIYHCGVAVDMNYRPSSSGAVTSLLCTTAPQYFSYTNAMVNIYRDDYTKEAYLQFVYDAIDMNWPMVHRGGGHAYVLDGYDDAGMVHFNWGWSGSSDGFFDIDGHNYTDGQSVIYNFVPASVYSATADLPTNLSVTPAADNELAATVVWNNPSKTLTNQNLTSIDQIVVMRNNEVIYTEDNVTPGAAMSFVDNTVPCFDAYTYRVYAVINGQIGKSAVVKMVNIGPTCQWKFIITSNNIMGWRGSYIAIRNVNGSLVDEVTVENSTPAAINVAMPVGQIQLSWVAAEGSTSYTMSINVKDSENNSVYSYNGTNTNMEEGVFFTDNNGCGNEAPAEAPADLYVTGTDTDIVLNWTGVREDGYGYNVYRDGKLIRLSYDTEFVDENPSIGGHCYSVSFLGLGGESELSNEACGNAGEGCDTGSNLWYELQANFKPIITWEAPEVSEGLSGYLVYRKRNEDGEYERVKIVSPSKTEFKDNSALTPDNWYYYKVIPYYMAIDCYAAPIKAMYGDNYYLKIYYSTDNVDEVLAGEVGIYPNPTTGVFTIETANITNVDVYNLIGQKVMSAEMNADKANIDMTGFDTGIYMVKVTAGGVEITRKLSVIK